MGVFDLPSGSMLAAACVCHGSQLAPENRLRMLQALQVRPSQVLAVAVSVMGFDYSHGRRPPSDPQCIPVASLRRVTACVSPCYAQNVTLLQVCAAVRSPASAAPRPPIGLRERRARRFTRHHRPTLQSDSSQPSFAATIRGTPS